MSILFNYQSLNYNYILFKDNKFNKITIYIIK